MSEKIISASMLDGEYFLSLIEILGTLKKSPVLLNPHEYSDSIWLRKIMKI